MQEQKQSIIHSEHVSTFSSPVGCYPFIDLREVAVAKITNCL